jgi:hypothetical protein
MASLAEAEAGLAGACRSGRMKVMEAATTCSVACLLNRPLVHRTWWWFLFWQLHKERCHC